MVLAQAPSADAPAEFFREQVERAKEVLSADDPARILDDPYLVSALYYSDSYFSKHQKPRAAHSPQDDIIVTVKPLLQAKLEDRFLAGLRIRASVEPDMVEKDVVVAPLDVYEFRRCGARCHQDAVDLFTEEGSVVRSMVRGVVVLSENGWQADQMYSAVSRNVGNEVIIFNPETDRFYRYCHLSTVRVRVGEVVPAGLAIGTVGHSGSNASRRGHGQHLHLEINQHDSATRSRNSLTRKQLTKLLKNLKSA